MKAPIKEYDFFALGLFWPDSAPDHRSVLVLGGKSRYPIDKTSINFNLTKNPQPGILGRDTLLDLVKWCEVNSDRSATFEQNKLENPTRDKSPEANNNSGRNGPSIYEKNNRAKGSE